MPARDENAAYRRLGNSGIEVMPVGLGCMGMSMWYGSHDDTENAKVLERAVELGVTLFDTADNYGPHRNEELLGRVLKPYRRDLVLCTKFGFIFDDQGNSIGFDGSPAHMRESIEGSLRRLQTDYIDVYFLHRVDANVPVEESVGAMAELVDEGKVRALGLSEPGPDSLKRAHEVHPIAVVQSEYSLWTRTVEDLLPLLRERDIGLIAYSPLGRGFLTGTIRSEADLAEADIRRRRFPRFEEQNLKRNAVWLEGLEGLARQKGCSLAQLSLAWVLAKGEDIVAIPGTKKIRYLEDNVAAGNIRLEASEVRYIEDIVAEAGVAGDQKDAHGMRLMGR